MKNILLILLFLVTVVSYGQSDQEYWHTWDTGYPPVDIVKTLKQEKHYADSVEKHQISPYYFRLDKFRFKAEYLGKTRSIDKGVLTSMKNVFKLTIGNPNQLDGLVENEVLFRVGKEDIWMPIQSQIFKAFKKEVAKGTSVTLYCLFFNEHNSNNVLYNTFLISEFNQ